ncbi:MAG: DUF4173 domain-containing protein [Ferruginibacter sp.]
MNKEYLKTILVITGAVLFNIIFWQEKMALNVLLFDAFILCSVFYLYPSVLKRTEVRWLLPAHLITVIALVVHNTVLSKLAFSGTLLLIIAFTQYLHRSAWYAAGSAWMNFLLMIYTFFGNISGLRKVKLTSIGLRKKIRFLIIPLIITALFVLLYSFANNVFSDVIANVATAIQKWFSRLFDWVSWQRFWFLLFGLFISGGLLLKSKINTFSKADLNKTDELKRKKLNFSAWKKSGVADLLHFFMGRFATGAMALRNENSTGLISLLLLNILLLFINVLDIVYVWFGFSFEKNINMSAYVHEGAGLLIFSIVLAMMVLLFFFRGNLNFYKKNKWLRYGAYAWIAQNIILVISVLIRDYYYFVHYGMAYKRIGVIVFLMLVMFGLVTVFIKIHFKKTSYYLFRVNAWFAIGMLVVSSCIHWDEWIATHNLAHKQTIPIDVKFLLSLSDKTLPVIEQNQDVLEESFLSKDFGEADYLYRGRVTPKQYFEMRKKDFFAEQQNYSWLSWNEADAYVKAHLQQNTLTAETQRR